MQNVRSILNCSKRQTASSQKVLPEKLCFIEGDRRELQKGLETADSIHELGIKYKPFVMSLTEKALQAIGILPRLDRITIDPPIVSITDARELGIGQKKVVTNKPIRKGQAIAEYVGKFIEKPTIDATGKLQSIVPKEAVSMTTGNFKSTDGTIYTIAPTVDARNFACYMNSSEEAPNLASSVSFDSCGIPHVLFFAVREISPGEELMWNYHEFLRANLYTSMYELLEEIESSGFSGDEVDGYGLRFLEICKDIKSPTFLINANQLISDLKAYLNE
tara:strand:+ start:928 stop:1755 length:828 start_codon:yes stop_codon:yes gene_type:complete